MIVVLANGKTKPFLKTGENTKQTPENQVMFFFLLHKQFADVDLESQTVQHEPIGLIQI